MDQIVSWLENYQQYAKTIVSLAGIRVTPAKGVEIGVACWWNGEKFEPPVHFSYITPLGRFSWTARTETPLLFRKTLGKMEETFREMVIKPHTIVMYVTISDYKKAHFLRFSFVKERLPLEVSAYDGELVLQDRVWTFDELDSHLRECKRIRKWLRGIGYDAS